MYNMYPANIYEHVYHTMNLLKINVFIIMVIDNRSFHTFLKLPNI